VRLGRIKRNLEPANDMNEHGKKRREKSYGFLFPLYHMLWTLAAVFIYPVAGLSKDGRLRARLGFDLPQGPLNGGAIWLHALSVGEVISAVPLVRKLRERYPARDLVLTVATSKGMSIARSELINTASFILYMPVDFWWCVRRIAEWVRPDLFIIVETDIWPAMTDYMKRRGIMTLLVNGRISPRTFRSYRRFNLFSRMIFNGVTLCLMQSELDEKRLKKAGVNPQKIRREGNIKFDRDWLPMQDRERGAWLDLFGFNRDEMIWVAGSTHKGEEEILLDVYRDLSREFAKLRLVIAPRRIDEAEDIVRVAREKGLRPLLRSELKEKAEPGHLIVLDTLGELGRVYGISHVSFVGGSLVPLGGHNLLEPAGFGCPVVFGRFIHNFQLMSEMLLESGGGRCVSGREELKECIRGFIEDENLRTGAGRLAKSFVEENRGALDRVLGYIESGIERADEGA